MLNDNYYRQTISDIPILSDFNSCRYEHVHVLGTYDILTFTANAGIRGITFKIRYVSEAYMYMHLAYN